VSWIVPQWVQNAQIELLLDSMSSPLSRTAGRRSAAPTFENVGTPLVYANGEAKLLTRLTGDSIPPILTGYLATFGAGVRQAVGAIGKGMHAFVFEGNSVHACNPRTYGATRR